MKRELLHLWGPLSINSFGLAIVVGLIVFYWLIRRHPEFKRLKLEEKFTGILLCGILAGLVGGRLLSIISDPEQMSSFAQMCSPWLPGYSIMGGVLAIVITLPLYLRLVNVPTLPFMDLVAIHAPLLQSISRIGCFLAGCCYGQATRLPWGVIYTDPQSSAPLYMRIHPTQLYSAFILLCIFALMYFVLQNILRKRGQLICAYLILVSAERFFVDFWRDDRIPGPTLLQEYLSIDQTIAAVTCIGSMIGFIWLSLSSTNTHTKP